MEEPLTFKMSLSVHRCPMVKSEQHQQAVQFAREPMFQQSGPAAGHVTPVSQNTSDQMLRPQPKLTSDWIVHFRKKDGRRFYHNIKSRESTWHKPYQLMTLNERADSTTNWREVTTKDGMLKYYYNEVTEKSTWTMPHEIQLARTKFHAESSKGADVLSSYTDFSEQENNAPTSDNTELPVALNNSEAQMTIVDESSNKDSNIALCEDVEGAPDEKIENAPETVETAATTTTVEQKIVKVDSENVQDAKTAFRALLESVNVRSDWTWTRAMKLIINDKRYAALTPHVKRTKTFDEFLEDKKKQEADKRRARQKIARENFRTMLEESKDLTASTTWRKTIAIFEHDERFIAVRRVQDREDMLQAYREELQEKESKLHKLKRKEYIEYLRSCDFIKSCSKWSNVQHSLEADKCSSLDISERFDIFQDYLYDLKEKEVRRKLKIKETQKAERKNRYDFRKLMEGQIAAGKLQAKTSWDDFYLQIKDLSAYKAVSANNSGGTPKDLFEIVVEDLNKKYMEDRSKVTVAEKSGKFTMSRKWMLEEFKVAVLANFSPGEISENNLKMIYEELKLRLEKKEERRRHLVRDFYVFLHGLKEITTSSTWEDCNRLFDKRFREEGILRETFQNYVLELKENDREKKRNRRKMKEAKKEEQKREKECRRKEREKMKERDLKEDRSYVLKKLNKQSKKKYLKKKERQRTFTDICYGEYDETKHCRHKRQKKH